MQTEIQKFIAAEILRMALDSIRATNFARF